MTGKDKKFLREFITIIVTVAGVLALMILLTGCTYDRVAEIKAGGVSISGTRIILLQRTSATFDRGTSGTLKIGYNNDSQPAVDLAAQAMALAIQAAKTGAVK